MTFVAGESFVDIDLTAIDDIATEPDETLKLNLATGFGYTIDSANNTATSLFPPTPLQMSIQATP